MKASRGRRRGAAGKPVRGASRPPRRPAAPRKRGSSAGFSPAARRAPEVPAALGRLRGESCARCGAPLCGHQAILALACGFEEAPHCGACLAAILGRQGASLRGRLLARLHSEPGLASGWARASADEGFRPGALPGCLWPDVGREPGADPQVPAAALYSSWDAGPLGCGDLVIELRARLLALSPGDVLKLTAADPGAPEDLPAWCRLSGHRLAFHRHPIYWIQRKET